MSGGRNVIKRSIFTVFQLFASLLFRLVSFKNKQKICKRELLFNMSGQSYWASIFLKKLILYGKAHERKVSETVSKIRGKLFVDVGANIGYYSMLLSPNFKEVYAFEPYDKSFVEMCWNIHQFRIKNVKPVMKAVANKNGKERMLRTDYGRYHQLISGQQLIDDSLSKHPKVPKVMSSILVETVTLASFFPNTVLDLVKVDVEGAEWRILKGAEPIMENIKSWVVELHNWARKKELEHWFASHGYKFRWIDFNKETANHIYAWKS